MDKWMSQIDKLVTKAKISGKNTLSYVELSAILNLTPNYARELLKIYAIKNNMKYEKGRLILGAEHENSDI